MCEAGFTQDFDLIVITAATVKAKVAVAQHFSGH
jgi:hypothetical protein